MAKSSKKASPTRSKSSGKTKSSAKPASSKSTSSRAKDFELDRLEELFKLMAGYQIAELDWETNQQRIHVRGQGAGATQSMPAMSYPVPAQAFPQSHAPQHAPAPQTTSAPVVSDAAPEAAPSNTKQILSPLVGTFYRSASPTADPYIKEGQAVKKGEVLCIIEAMKLMNEIESEYAGKIVSILVENGQPVEFGEPLFVIQI